MAQGRAPMSIQQHCSGRPGWVSKRRAFTRGVHNRFFCPTKNVGKTVVKTKWGKRFWEDALKGKKSV